MHPLLDIPQPRLARLQYGLSSADHAARWKQWQSEGYDGIEVSTFGRAFGPTWPQGKTYSLDFLADFPGLKALTINVDALESLEPLSPTAGSLEWLSLGGWMEPAKCSCQPIAECGKLQSLAITRIPKDLEAIEALTGLEALTLLGFTLKSLGVVRPLKNLQRLWIGFGSLPDIGPVAELPKLKALEMIRVRKLADLSPLSAVKTLQYLALDEMKQVERMPDCSRNRALRRVYLAAMNGLADLTGLTKAPNLEDLIVVDSKIDASVFDPIIADLKLKRVTVGLASRKATQEIHARLGQRAVNLFGTAAEKMVLE